VAFGVCIYHNAREDDKILKTLLDWLNVNSGAVTAIATAVGAVVTAIYAFFTILLWRVTKEQAAITRHIFEASHRPYVTVRAQEPPETHVQGRLLFHMVFENQGTVPADITAWEVRGTLMDLDGHEQPLPLQEPMQSPVGRSLAPRELASIELHFVCGGLPNPPLPFRLRGRVEYQGMTSSLDSTDFDAERFGESWTTQGRKMR